MDLQKIREKKRKLKRETIRQESEEHKILIDAIVNDEPTDRKVRRACNDFIAKTLKETGTAEKLLGAAGVNPEVYYE